MHFLFKYRESLKFETGNENLCELAKDALLHPMKVLLFFFGPLFRLSLVLNDVRFGSNVRLYGRPRIDNRGTIRLGNKVRLISHSAAYSSGNLMGPVFLRTSKTGSISIGDDVYLNGTMIISEAAVTIGSRTMIGANTIIVDTNTHNINPKSRLHRWDQIKRKPVAIGEDVWIGSHVLILNGSRIGNGSVIGAGSVVMNDVLPNSLYAGNPARLIKQLDPEA